jgi:hypothetical protein
MGETDCRREVFLSVFICVHLWFQLLFLGLMDEAAGRQEKVL